MGEFACIEWLFNESTTALIENILSLIVYAVTAREHDAHITVNLSQPVKGLSPAHSRHDHVENNQIDSIPI